MTDSPFKYYMADIPIITYGKDISDEPTDNQMKLLVFYCGYMW